MMAIISRMARDNMLIWGSRGNRRLSHKSPLKLIPASPVWCVSSDTKSRLHLTDCPAVAGPLIDRGVAVSALRAAAALVAAKRLLRTALGTMSADQTTHAPVHYVFVFAAHCQISDVPAVFYFAFHFLHG